MHWTASLIIALALTVAAPEFSAQGRGKGKAAQQHSDDRNSTVSVNVTFGREDQRLIRAWFAEPANLRGLPPGLANKEQLPPGLQRQLVRNGQLPPGLQKKIQPLPEAIEVRLPRLPEGRRRIFISGNVILFDERNNVVLDMFAVF